MSDTRWPNFTRRELECRCGCGLMNMNEDFMDLIQALRADLGFAFIVTSASRCPEHDRAIGGAGCHPLGLAIDIACYLERAFALQERALASRLGIFKTLSPMLITGIGVKQHGPIGARFLHLDAMPILRPDHPRPRVWSYK